MMMVHGLSQAGCEVSVAPTGKKGVELAQQDEFDLAILNTRLPDMSGFEVTDEMRQRQISRHAQLIFIAHQYCKEDHQQAVELGVADYIEKPFEPSDFVRRILAHASDNSETNKAIQTATA